MDKAGPKATQLKMRLRSCPWCANCPASRWMATAARLRAPPVSKAARPTVYRLGASALAPLPTTPITMARRAGRWRPCWSASRPAHMESTMGATANRLMITPTIRSSWPSRSTHRLATTRVAAMQACRAINPVISQTKVVGRRGAAAFNRGCRRPQAGRSDHRRCCRARPAPLAACGPWRGYAQPRPRWCWRPPAASFAFWPAHHRTCRTRS